MSQISTSSLDVSGGLGTAGYGPAQIEQVAPYLARSPHTWAAFLPATALCGLSALAGGISFLTDLGFVALTIAAAWLLCIELVRFPARFGLGAVVLYGGVLIFFCSDYLRYWLGTNFADPTIPYTAEVVARSALAHCLFIMLMVIGMNWKVLRFLEKPFSWLPEPRNRSLYFWVAVAVFAFGISPYFLFTGGNPFGQMWQDMTAGRSATFTSWTVGRTGNLNYNYSAYVAQILDVGDFGGIFAAVLAILVIKNPFQRAILIMIWFFWVARGFGSGTRGYIVYQFVPVMAAIFLKLQAEAAERRQLINMRAYLFAAAVGVVGLGMVTVMTVYRNQGFTQVNLGETLTVENIKGTEMFTTTLEGFKRIPDVVPIYYSSIPGEYLVRPIPQLAYWFVIGPVPRAIWTEKPIDPVWVWYNRMVTGQENLQGTTISNGLVGWFYFRFGYSGIIQGALFFGLLYGVTERVFQNAAGRPMHIIFSLACATFLFRCFRDPNFQHFYPVVIAAVVLSLLIYALGGRPRHGLTPIESPR
jgi:hypothetical protein